MLKKKVITILLSALMISSTLVLPSTTVKAAAINGWQKSGTTWNYYISGNKAANWISSGGKWYYLNPSGEMATGWILSSGKWYYLNPNGDMATGWISSGSNWYYLKSNGDMAVSETTPDGYVIGADGVWIVGTSSVSYSGSIEKMQLLGVIDKSILDGNGVVTRGQLVKTIAIADGLTSTASSLKGATIFPDIASNSDLSGYVNAVINAGTTNSSSGATGSSSNSSTGSNSNSGSAASSSASTSSNVTLISGMPDGNFHAEAGVTYAEACTILVRLLGYKDSDLSGAWPNNYIQQASTLKLTTGINLNKSDKLTMGVEALLFDRLFDTLMKKASSTEADKYFSDIFYTDTTATGKLVQATILGNSKSMDNLDENQVLTDKGTLTINMGVKVPDLGAKYKLYIDGTSITKIGVKENTQENYAVTAAVGSNINYTNENNVVQNMTLPTVATSYYYRGAKLNYDAAVAAIQKYSSIILSRNSDATGYDYGIIVDPWFGSPQIYKTDNTGLINKINSTKVDFIYKNGYSYSSSSSVYLNNQDVVYFVSDIWSRNTFIYVHVATVVGEVTALTPNKFNANSITIKITSISQVKVVGGSTVGGVTAGDTTTTNYQYTSTTYQLSQYFNKASINNYNGANSYSINNINVGETRTLILGIDGKVVGIY